MRKNWIGVKEYMQIYIEKINYNLLFCQPESVGLCSQIFIKPILFARHYAMYCKYERLCAFDEQPYKWKNKSQKSRILINGLKTVVNCCRNAEGGMREGDELTNPASRVGVLTMCTCVLLKDK